jgi:protein translocase SecG subunit
MVYSILVFLLVLVSILLIGIILLQSGQGDMGAAMGGNTMNQAFGSEGADKLLVRITTTLAAVFMVLAISIQWFGKADQVEGFDEVNTTLPALNKENSSTDEGQNQGIPLQSTP